MKKEISAFVFLNFLCKHKQSILMWLQNTSLNPRCFISHPGDGSPHLFISMIGQFFPVLVY